MRQVGHHFGKGYHYQLGRTFSYTYYKKVIPSLTYRWKGGSNTTCYSSCRGRGDPKAVEALMFQYRDASKDKSPRGRRICFEISSILFREYGLYIRKGKAVSFEEIVSEKNHHKEEQQKRATELRQLEKDIAAQEKEIINLIRKLDEQEKSSKDVRRTLKQHSKSFNKCTVKRSAGNKEVALIDIDCIYTNDNKCTMSGKICRKALSVKNSCLFYRNHR